MKTSFIAAAVCLATVPHGVAAQGAPIFQFRDIVADQPFDLKAAGYKRCSNMRDGSKLCLKIGDRVAEQVVSTWITAKDNRLWELRIEGQRGQLAPILEAFKLKYGKPCETRSEQWQNAVGASLDNLVSVWCFAGGKLEARSIGKRINQFEVTYVDVNNSPAPTPKVDF